MAMQLSYWADDAHGEHYELRNVRMSRKQLDADREELIRSRPPGTTLITFWSTNKVNSKGGIRGEETVWSKRR